MSFQNATPYVEWEMDGYNFRSIFLCDVQECAKTFWEQIVDLIDDTDSSNVTLCRKDLTPTEFAQQKDCIYNSVKELTEAKLLSWKDYIDRMTNNYLVNVKQFLDNVKLKGKLLFS